MNLIINIHKLQKMTEHKMLCLCLACVARTNVRITGSARCDKSRIVRFFVAVACHRTLLLSFINHIPRLPWTYFRRERWSPHLSLKIAPGVPGESEVAKNPQETRQKISWRLKPMLHVARVYEYFEIPVVVDQP